MLILNHLHRGIHDLLCYHNKLQGLYKFRLWLSLNLLNGTLLLPSSSSPLGPVSPNQMWCSRSGLPNVAQEVHTISLSLWAPVLHHSTLVVAFFTARAHCWQRRAHTVFLKLYRHTLVLCAIKGSTASTVTEKRAISPKVSLAQTSLRKRISQFSYYLLVQRAGIHLLPFTFPFPSSGAIWRQAERKVRRRQNRWKTDSSPLWLHCFDTQKSQLILWLSEGTHTLWKPQRAQQQQCCLTWGAPCWPLSLPTAASSWGGRVWHPLTGFVRKCLAKRSQQPKHNTSCLLSVASSLRGRVSSLRGGRSETAKPLCKAKPNMAGEAGGRLWGGLGPGPSQEHPGGSCLLWAEWKGPAVIRHKVIECNFYPA